MNDTAAVQTPCEEAKLVAHLSRLQTQRGGQLSYREGVYMCMYMHTRVYICMCIYIQGCAYVYVYTYMDHSVVLEPHVLDAHVQRLRQDVLEFLN